MASCYLILLAQASEACPLITCIASHRQKWDSGIHPLNARVWPPIIHHISSSSESAEMRSFSMADLIMPMSVVEGLRSSAVEKYSNALSVFASRLKILPIWKYTLASLGALSCNNEDNHSRTAVVLHKIHDSNGIVSNQRQKYLSLQDQSNSVLEVHVLRKKYQIEFCSHLGTKIHCSRQHECDAFMHYK